ncbi:MAG: efflux RND transporter permease subunit, partial [Janthinobacterium sp.]
VASLGLTAPEVIAAVRQANSQVAAGVLNQPPGGSDGAYQVQVQAQSRLRDVAEFEAIVVAAHADGGVVRLRDVARVEMGAQDYTESGFVDNRTAIALGISLLPGSNALATGDRVLAQLAKMEAEFPQDVAYHAYYNPTEFIRFSIDKVRDTIFEAALLVCVAMLLFLGSWRAAIIPILAIPVSLVGTFTVLAAMGYTLNTLSLFGLVLAIGIVVDDAIVVVENVERHMEEGMSPVAAAQRSMNEVGFALVAIALVLVAVFVPLAFISGLVLLLCGVLRLGFMASFLSRPVISGFSNGAAILIIWGQITPLLGATWPHWHTPSLVLGLSGLLFLWLAKRYLSRLLQRCGLGKVAADVGARLAPMALVLAGIALLAALYAAYAHIHSLAHLYWIHVGFAAVLVAAGLNVAVI